MDISKGLLYAVRDGDLKQTQELLSKYSLSHAPAWSEGYVLLQSALLHRHGAIAKLLLSSGARVNGDNKILPTPLHIAVETGNMDVVQMLLCRDVNINAQNSFGIRRGETPLHIASEMGFTHLVEALLSHGANINGPMDNGYTPLHIAVEKNKENVVEMLLNKGADINLTAADGISPLHVATKRTNREVIKLLLARGAKSNARDDKGETALFYAVEMGCSGIVDLFLKCSPDIDIKCSNSSFEQAILTFGQNYDKIVDSFLQYGFSVCPEDKKNSALFHAAIKKGYSKIVKQFLELGADADMRDSKTGRANRPIHNAVEHKHKELVSLLLKYGADVNALDEFGAPATLYAIKNANVEITKLLISNGASIDDNPDLLITAVNVRCKEIVEVLLEHGADIDASDRGGRTALHFTVLGLNSFENIYKLVITSQEPNEEFANLLLRRGIDVNAQTNQGLTTLHTAVEKGSVEVVQTLLKHNANVNCADKRGMTAFHFAAMKEYEPISKMLLESGANVNAQQTGKFSNSGDTPLHVAVENSNDRTVELLLQFGADVDSLTIDGDSPLHTACKKGQSASIVKILLEYGADINIVNDRNRTPFDYVIRSECYEFDDEEYYDYFVDDDDDMGYEILEVSYTGDYFDPSVIKQHIVKMVVAGLFVNERDMELINNLDYKDFQIVCQQELEDLTAEKIANSKVSFHDVLTTATRRLAVILGNRDVVKVLELDDHEGRFPLYASIIRGRFRRALMRKNLMEQGHRCLQVIFQDYPQLPSSCIEIILDYLCNADIRNLINITNVTY